MKTRILFALWLCGRASEISGAADFDSLCADRTGIERIYFNHRPGSKPPLEQVLPRELIEKLVRQDLPKEVVLKRVYGIEITGAMLAAEVQRVNTTPRAPDILAELKAALDNDDSLHAPRRRELEAIRGLLIQSEQDEGPAAAK